MIEGGGGFRCSVGMIVWAAVCGGTDGLGELMGSRR